LKVESDAKPFDKVVRRNPAQVGNNERHSNGGIKPFIAVHFFFQDGDCRGAGYKKHHHHKK
jgi:hypothetical protein